MEKSSEEAAGGEEAARAQDGAHRWLRKPHTPNRHSIGNVPLIYAPRRRFDVLQKIRGFVVVVAAGKKK